MSIELETTGAKIVLGVLVVVLGALGGLAAELLRTRPIGGKDEEGAIEWPRRLTARYYDLGTPAGMFLGAIAAALAMGIFQPIDEIVKAQKTVQEYDFWQVVALTLVAGFSAPKFLTLAQERFLALLTQQRVESALVSTKEVAQAMAKTATEQARNVPADTTAVESTVQSQADAISAIADMAIGQSP